MLLTCVRRLDADLHIRGGPAALEAAAANARRVVAFDADDVFTRQRERRRGVDRVLLDRRRVVRELDLSGPAVLRERWGRSVHLLTYF